MGDTLISLLRQIRAGYPDRPQTFPQTVLLCGVRDVRDHRIHNGDNQVITGGSAFNIKSKSLRLGNFSQGDITVLYAQHTEETGQAFESGVIDYIFEQTGGQPWLVNALANEACFEMETGRERSRSITLTDMFDARERLIERRDIHLDQAEADYTALYANLEPGARSSGAREGGSRDVHDLSGIAEDARRYLGDQRLRE